MLVVRICVFIKDWKLIYSELFILKRQSMKNWAGSWHKLYSMHLPVKRTWCFCLALVHIAKNRNWSVSWEIFIPTLIQIGFRGEDFLISLRWTSDWWQRRLNDRHQVMAKTHYTLLVRWPKTLLVCCHPVTYNL